MSNEKVRRFINKWGRIQQSELAIAQSHFIDVCELVGHLPPLAADPEGNYFSFETPTEKIGGTRGRADVWYDKKFIWEYKGAHANLDKAYQQLLLYRETLGNPPLLITSDTKRIIIHTNFTNTIKETFTIDFPCLEDGNGLDLLKRAFYNPDSFKPKQTQSQITQASVKTFAAVSDTLKEWELDEGQKDNPEQLAHFIIRLLFLLFAEDMGLLPDNLFTKLLDYDVSNIEHFTSSLKTLFATMKSGGKFGYYEIRNFDGGLFDDDFVPDLPGGILHSLRLACNQDWSGIDPSIFGTLFERIIDESKRKQLGAHYTSQEDIRLVVEPVLMMPLRKRWQYIKQEALNNIIQNDHNRAHHLLSDFASQIASIRVLDPACGSGNFLYVALKQLLDLQKEVIAFAGLHGLNDIPLSITPAQLFGIEINPYAHELAQITVWIGYLQWRIDNGFAEITEPILNPLRNIKLEDAILDHDSSGKPIIPAWPEAEIVTGNPPFLGSRSMRPVFGDRYCDELLKAHGDRIKGLPDLVCFWFSIAQLLIEKGRIKRVGLLATQSIRGGTNRNVLDRIVEQGGIFMAWSDKEWILDGAMVHVSIIGFDDGSEKQNFLDGKSVAYINSDLTSEVDISYANQLHENSGLSFQGVVLRGEFNISSSLAEEMLEKGKNPSGLSNSDIIKLRRTGKDIAGRSSNSYVIDFGVDVPIEQAMKYVLPFEYVKKHIYPMRQKTRQVVSQEKWWIHWNPRVQMKEALSKLERYIATPRVGKHRIFVWLSSSIIPDAQLVVFAREDDYFFGVLHSKVHELWARRKGTQLRDAESGFRYTSTTTFETFPFPWSPGKEPPEDENTAVGLISEVARNLVTFRQSWLNPPDEDIGITISKSMLKKRTLTNMYNALDKYRDKFKGLQRNPRTWFSLSDGILELEEIETLDYLHERLDQAVLNAYGWENSASNDEILKNLLELNLRRSTNKK